MYKQGKFYAFAATGYLYSLIIVDLYRKLNGVNVENIRNIVYIFFFALLLIDMVKARHLKPMLTIAAVTMLLFGFSIIINPGYSSVYSASIMLFVSRLWPAYYIGRYTENWETLSKAVLLFSPIALAYAVSLFLIPEIAGGQAYATIASNLSFVSLISLYASVHLKKYIGLIISIICLIPVFFYGTRVYFVGVILSLFLAYVININNVSLNKRVVLFTILFIVVSVFLIAGDSIFEYLYNLFPDSRTLKMMAVGDFLDDSNRSSIYDKIIDHLTDNPLDMCGLIGDRIFLCPNGTTSEILSSFSHNCCLELCMNFGLFIGIILNIIFIKKLLQAVIGSFHRQFTINYIFMLILGAGFVDMMVSASYMVSYIPWLLFGCAFSICNSKIYPKG